MTLDTQQQILIEQRVNNEAKSPLLAYLLLIFVGMLGVHRFYLGKTGSGIVMLALLVVGMFTLPMGGFGLILIGALGLWLLIDLFLIPGMINAQRREMRDVMTRELAAG